MALNSIYLHLHVKTKLLKAKIVCTPLHYYYWGEPRGEVLVSWSYCEKFLWTWSVVQSIARMARQFIPLSCHECRQFVRFVVPCGMTFGILSILFSELFTFFVTFDDFQSNLRAAGLYSLWLRLITN